MTDRYKNLHNAENWTVLGTQLYGAKSMLRIYLILAKSNLYNPLWFLWLTYPYLNMWLISCEEIWENLDQVGRWFDYNDLSQLKKNWNHLNWWHEQISNEIKMPVYRFWMDCVMFTFLWRISYNLNGFYSLISNASPI